MTERPNAIAGPAMGATLLRQFRSRLPLGEPSEGSDSVRETLPQNCPRQSRRDNVVDQVTSDELEP
jgi:hypothetical protein